MTTLRNLLYIAITHLKSQLYFSFPTYNSPYARVSKQQTPFIKDKPSTILIKPLAKSKYRPITNPFEYLSLTPQDYFKPVTRLIKQQHQRKHPFRTTSYCPDWYFATGHSLLMDRYRDVSGWKVNRTRKWIREQQRQQQQQQQQEIVMEACSDDVQSQSLLLSPFYSAQSCNSDEIYFSDDDDFFD